ncbi:hypothetical protein TRVL_00786 [Trypanosoma vivax]|uniref:Uncharacterized protein n=1 Tax=Trypanosoma vivax (strain Y486) TaxID=1055687 RepID=G0U122_TRYVY|nr:hypothetical protein TRVL_00786 [Trypanosoma vivax]CCC49777.1 conserved hypothetical protein [Trypanosoma vivax Y486]
MLSDATSRKRGRPEGDGAAAAECCAVGGGQSAAPLLRCPWCSDGYLMRPVSSEKVPVPLCSLGEGCPCYDIVEQDITLAFSGMRGSDLVGRFYDALDSHIASCSNARRSSYCGCQYQWSIIAERSLLFAPPLGEEKSGVPRLVGEQRLQPHSRDPVFYFLKCEKCGETNFVC